MSLFLTFAIGACGEPKLDETTDTNESEPTEVTNESNENVEDSESVGFITDFLNRDNPIFEFTTNYTGFDVVVDSDYITVEDEKYVDGNIEARKENVSMWLEQYERSYAITSPHIDNEDTVIKPKSGSLYTKEFVESAWEEELGDWYEDPETYVTSFESYLDFLRAEWTIETEDAARVRLNNKGYVIVGSEVEQDIRVIIDSSYFEDDIDYACEALRIETVGDYLRVELLSDDPPIRDVKGILIDGTGEVKVVGTFYDDQTEGPAQVFEFTIPQDKLNTPITFQDREVLLGGEKVGNYQLKVAMYESAGSNFAQQIGTVRVSYGETIPGLPTEIQGKKVLKWYTDFMLTNEYVPGKPVTASMDLYAITE
jgi:hypothetical protein